MFFFMSTWPLGRKVTLRFRVASVVRVHPGAVCPALFTTRWQGERLVVRGLCHCPAYPPGVLRSSRQRGDPAVGEYFSPADLPGDLVHVVEKFRNVSSIFNSCSSVKVLNLSVTTVVQARFVSGHEGGKSRNSAGGYT